MVSEVKTLKMSPSGRIHAPGGFWGRRRTSDKTDGKTSTPVKTELTSESDGVGFEVGKVSGSGVDVRGHGEMVRHIYRHTPADYLKWKVGYSDVRVDVDRFGRSGGQTEPPESIWWGFCRRLSMSVTS